MYDKFAHGREWSLDCPHHIAKTEESAQPGQAEGAAEIEQADVVAQLQTSSSTPPSPSQI